MTHKCAHPGCDAEGTFPAPKDPQNIYDRQYFCELHIKEFNKKWNGLTGMTHDDVLAMQTKSTWERPTWRFGIDGMSAKTAGFSFDRAEDLYHFFKQRQREELQNKANADKQSSNQPQELPDDVKEACIILNVALPMEPARLKRKYLKLVKKHHPDTASEQTREHSEEMIKKINVSYQILKDFTARHL